MRKWVLLGFVLLLAIDTTATVLLKLAGERIGAFELALPWLRRIVREPLMLAIAGCYVASFVTYTSLLKYAAVGPAYAAAHGQVVTVLIVSMLWFGERLTLVQAAGCTLIVAGIIVLGVTEKLEAERKVTASPAVVTPPAPAADGETSPTLVATIAAAEPAAGPQSAHPPGSAGVPAGPPRAHPFSRSRSRAGRQQRGTRRRRGRP